MPAYAYPIIIKEEKQIVISTESFEITDDWMTLKDLQKLVKPEDKFYFYADAEEGFTARIFIEIRRTRLETDQEQAKRVSREKAYMAEYNRRQKNKKS